MLLCTLLISNTAYGQKLPATSANTPNHLIEKPQHDVPLVVNEYTEVLGYNICTNQVRVADASLYNVGDTVLMIQMQGVEIDTSNSASFGTIINYHNAGNYEMNYISAKSANIITLSRRLMRQYDIPNGKVQLIRVPYFKRTNYIGEFTCPAWDGSKGGVLVMTAEVLELKDDIEISAKGFRRAGADIGLTSVTCAENSYVLPATNKKAAFKGEGVTPLSQNINKGKANPANGGGGGLSNNSGGGGGANAGNGGYGGYQSDTCSNAPFDNRGWGGKGLVYSSTANKLFMGGGGGAGHAENVSSPAAYEARGGGIAILIADTIISNTAKIISNGGDGNTCNVADCNDGMYGGGGGGVVALYVDYIADALYVETRGGKGASVSASFVPGGRVGPGGGGGGGVFFLNKTALTVNETHDAAGGFNGVIYADGNNPWGAGSGTEGITMFDMPDPVSIDPFKPNIDSVRINNSINYCNNIRFNGLGFTNTYPVSSWQWYFDDGGTGSGQNPTHNYNATGNYNVKLVITDINGCKDSIIKTINTAGPMLAEAGRDTTFCASDQRSYTLNGSGTGSSYSWSPTAVLNNSTLQNPTATINATTKFYLTVSNGTGCTAIDSVTLSAVPAPALNITKSNDLNCNKPFAQLNASGAITYTWLPAYALSNDSIANPIANPVVTTTYYVYGKDTGTCAGTDSITVIAGFKNHGIILPNSFTPKEWRRTQ